MVTGDWERAELLITFFISVCTHDDGNNSPLKHAALCNGNIIDTIASSADVI